MNLSLRVLGKRRDGFHKVETLMTPLRGLSDHLHFEPAEQYHLDCDEPGVPTDGSNLVTRAVRLFEQESKEKVGYRIRLEKNIPHGAGLGGGSSDAAATLLGLNALYDEPIDFDKLSQMGASLGSDVPFFFFDEACWCRGRGTDVEAAGIEWNETVLLFKPAFPVSTEQAYKRWKFSREHADIPYGAQEIAGVKMVNDLERPVFEKHLFLAILKRKLLATEGVAGAMMSGSGSTVFAVLEEGVDGEKLAEKVKSETDPEMWTWCGQAG
ncbi:4-(cytidine 5'-diphospho)-2-C-methyl-D-erythritol kinase [Roseibacillus ishigakijimensis]|uniref:4-diphosphocytidyl-2-C-methyl-D-erythritol kinase n=1 Tax=Roseibacillus ishigakijimensis TaxID=454146 RepID=A0A934VLA7_9BACT|nr:4-(cytidine 5'-diphospho)-2-C-methyl-D-erythritol kinase [Roseibacillus ishigakijimensis]